MRQGFFVQAARVSQQEHAYWEIDCKCFTTVRSSPDLYFVGNIRDFQISCGSFNVLSSGFEGINLILFLPLKTSCLIYSFHHFCLISLLTTGCHDTFFMRHNPNICLFTFHFFYSLKFIACSYHHPYSPPYGFLQIRSVGLILEQVEPGFHPYAHML